MGDLLLLTGGFGRCISYAWTMGYFRVRRLQRSGHGLSGGRSGRPRRKRVGLHAVERWERPFCCCRHSLNTPPFQAPSLFFFLSCGAALVWWQARRRASGTHHLSWSQSFVLIWAFTFLFVVSREDFVLQEGKDKG